MFILRFLSVVGLALWFLVISTSSPAAGKKSGQVECAATDVRLAYDCIITLTNKKTGQAINDVEFTVSADMPSMPGAHTVKPVAVMNHGMGDVPCSVGTGDVWRMGVDNGFHPAKAGSGCHQGYDHQNGGWQYPQTMINTNIR